MAQRTAYGGQAVIEGVMIRGKTRVATACRLKDGAIVVRRDEADGISQRYPILRLPFLRGTPALFDSLCLGYRTLMWSADLAMEGEPDQPKPTPFMYTVTLVLSMALGIGLFVLLPSAVLKWVFPGHEQHAASLSILQQLLPNWDALLPNLVEGILRVVMLVAYILLIGRNAELRRVFAYHGAEHKVVNAWEASGVLSLETAKRHSRIHPRCGTSFLFLTFVVGVIMHALFGWQELWLRLLVRLLMLPLIAGVAYELIRLAGRFRDALWLKLMVWPGLLLQQLTTAEPSDDQIEVAMTSMRTVLEDEGILEPVPSPIPPSEPAIA